jgi:hypothetical protein
MFSMTFFEFTDDFNVKKNTLASEYDWRKLVNAVKFINYSSDNWDGVFVKLKLCEHIIKKRKLSFNRALKQLLMVDWPVASFLKLC